MKTVAISDLHGLSPRDIYDEVIHFYEVYNEYDNLQRIDNIVFLGDLIDSKFVPVDLQIKRLLDLFEIKSCDNRIHILTGNHDVKYIDYKPGEYKDSRSTKSQIEEVVEIYHNHLQDIEYAFSDGEYIYSHTGISKKFLDGVNINYKGTKPEDIITQLNRMLSAKQYDKLFYVYDGLKYRHTLINTKNYHQFKNLLSDSPFNKQVVGHYDNVGLQINNGIYQIETPQHGNFILFES